MCIGTLSRWMTSPRPLKGPAAPGGDKAHIFLLSQAFLTHKIHRQSRTFQQLNGLLPEGLDQEVVQLQFLEFGNDLLLIATHLQCIHNTHRRRHTYTHTLESF